MVSIGLITADEIITVITVSPISRSLFIMVGENFTLSMFSKVPLGFEDPVECSISR